MSIVLLVITDGRADCLTKTLAGIDEHVSGPITRRIIHDDSADPDYRTWLATAYPDYELAWPGPSRVGFGEAIRSAWSRVAYGAEPYVCSWEDDFVPTRPVDVGAMSRLLMSRWYIAQVALLRQPWNAEEKAAGGIIERNPDAYIEHSNNFGDAWLEHRQFWTTNPSVYRQSLTRREWPEGAESEGRFGLDLLRYGTPEVPGDQVRFAFWGRRGDGPWVEHIGHQRVGIGY